MSKYTQAEREHVIKLFKFEPAANGKYFMSYEYRKKYSGFKAHKPILNDLLKEKLLRIERKDNKTILYEYLGK